jgi:putative ABC transport system permease protein
VRLPEGVRRLFRLGGVRPEVRRDVDDELDHHFAEVVRGYVARGLCEEEARGLARARFGDERAYRHALMRIDDGRVRMRERSELLDRMVRTMVHALRGVRRAPGFTISIVVILALGIGANAVMFGVVDRLLLSPPQHVISADDVRPLFVRRIGFNGDVFTGRTITWNDYLDFVSLNTFASMGAYAGPDERTVGRGEEAGQARVAAGSASFFPTLGVQPTLGRFFSEEDDRIGAPPTAVLAHEYWEREHGSDPEVLGTTIDIGRGVYTVIGVAPPGFTGARLEPVDIWLPLLVMQSLENGEGWMEGRGWYWLQAVGRLAPDATVEAAEAEATAAHRAGRAEQIAQGDYDEGAQVIAAPIIGARGPQQNNEARVAQWLAGVSLIVLLIACFNVANLLLARAVRAQREIAVRLALGIDRSRLVAELLAESLVLAGMGALAAVVVARFLGGVVHQTLLPDVAFTDTGLGVRLLVFTLVATLVAGLVTGLLPAWQATRTELVDALRAGGRSVAGGHSRTRVALLVGQAALSVVLLVGAGLFVRSLRQAEELDLGFDADRLLVIALEWNETLPAEERRVIYEDVLSRVRRLPGVHAAGLSYSVPFQSSIALGQPRVPGLDSVPRHHNGGPYVNKVGAGYFDAMRLTLLRGRGIEAADDVEGAPPVAVVSESMADAYWPAGDVLGACMIFDGDDDVEPQCTEVVGVVENHRRQALVEDDPHFIYYLNQGHYAFEGPPQSMMVGSSGDPSALLPRVRAEASAASSQVRFVEATTMSDLVEPDLRSWRLGASMFTVFGLLALIVAAWGLYSVLAFDVALRHHELGVRSALGADRARIVRLVLRQALVLVAVGTAIGLIAAAGAARFVEPLLFRVSGTDPATYAAVALALLTVAGLAGSLPAWRATRVDPREALQAE